MTTHLVRDGKRHWCQQKAPVALTAFDAAAIGSSLGYYNWPPQPIVTYSRDRASPTARRVSHFLQKQKRT